MGSLPELVASAWMAGAWTALQCDLRGLLELGAGGDAPSRVFSALSLLPGWVNLRSLPVHTPHTSPEGCLDPLYLSSPLC